jgi:hypothetical protein
MAMRIVMARNIKIQGGRGRRKTTPPPRLASLSPNKAPPGLSEKGIFQEAEKEPP